MWPHVGQRYRIGWVSHMVVVGIEVVVWLGYGVDVSRGWWLGVVDLQVNSGAFAAGFWD